MNNVYEKVKHKFSSTKDYNTNSIVQNNVKEQLLDISYKLVENIKISNILNLGIRNMSEPLELYNKFNPKKLDIADLTLANITTENFSKQNINFFELNFDEELHLLNSKYDLIFSNMSFQWSKDLNELIKNLEAKLNEKSVLSFTTLLSDNFYEISKILRVNEMPTRDSVLRIVDNHNLMSLYTDVFYYTLEFHNFSSLIDHLRKTGVHTYTGESSEINFRQIRNLLNKDYSYKLTYHVGLFICYKE
ncbi:biotin synthase [Pseudofrancisella aestuarii]|uniref:Biotin synthase n=1 Tax=Pseudofrancisella aestuarii TaxID=2670347 RepID=A0ABV9T9B0_9GAMM|nr:biotin synthase [Pseudofrancisella aestuarii]